MSNNAPDYKNDLVFPPKENKLDKIIATILGALTAIALYILINCIL